MCTPLNQYHVVMEVAPQFWQNPSTLHDIYVRSPTGAQVPLSAVARYEPTATLLSVNHQGQFPGITLSFNMAPGASLGEAVQAIEKSMREIGLPGDIRGSFQGTAKAFQASLENQPLLILAALVTVYIVLGILYESYIHPLTILSTSASRRITRAAPLQDGAEHDRVDRHHSADRDREEKRHHDDRLCVGCGAEGRETAGRGDL
jgi:multidrug efflux pump subunit AcrB